MKQDYSSKVANQEKTSLISIVYTKLKFVGSSFQGNVFYTNSEK